MRKKAIFITCVSLVVLLLLTVLASCSKARSKVKPENLVISNRILSWDAIENATEYLFSIDDKNYESVTTNSISLVEKVTSTDVKKLYVKAVIGKSKSDAATIDIQVSKLSAPAKPQIVIDEETNLQKFAWAEVEGVRKYLVQVNDGKWITYNKLDYTPPSTGDYVIKVKSSGYSNKNTIYLDSDPSEASDKLTFMEGPTLEYNNLNVINWSSAVEFDSYNLYVNGEKVKTGVKSPYNFVKGGAVTKTGEYKIQIEALKDGVSCWSNLLEQVGTSNINKNEIYSFDNRVYRSSLVKEGATVSNEKFHGESGYSLKINGVDQLNLLKYSADGINDVDYTKITQISYWIYIEPIEGYKFDYVPGKAVPAIKFDSTNTTTFTKQEKIPMGKWTKVTIDCVNEYDSILVVVFHNMWGPLWPDEVGRNYTMYIDDISYEKLDKELATDYKYKVRYQATDADKGSWTGSTGTELSFGSSYANKSVLVKAKVMGNATTSIKTPVGLATFSTKGLEKDSFVNFVEIEKNLLSKSTWGETVFELNLNAQGKTYVTAACWGEGRAPYDIYMKDVAILGSYEKKASYGADAKEMGSWVAKSSFELDYGKTNANKEVTIKANVMTTPIDHIKAPVGLGFFTDTALKDITTVGTFDRKLLKKNAWIQVSFKVKLNAEGKTNVAALCWSGEGQGVYDIYLKDIQMVATAATYDYKVSYDKAALDSASWNGKTPTELDFGVANANKQVVINAKVSGTASDKINLPTGFAFFSDAGLPKESFTDLVTIDKSLVNKSTWSTVSFAVTLNAQGKTYATAICWGEGVRDLYDIYMKDVNVAVAYDYKVSFDKAALDGQSWNGKTLTELDFGVAYANKEVIIKTKVMGTATDVITDPVGFAFFKDTAFANDSFTNLVELNKSLVNTSNYSEVTFNVQLNAEGKTYASAICWGTGGKALYDIYMKDVTVSTYDYKVSYDQAAKNSGGWFGKTPTELDFGVENANKTVTIKADVMSNLTDQITAPVGFLFFSDVELKTDTDLVQLDRALLTTNSFNACEFTVKLNAEGKTYGTAICWDGAGQGVYDIFMKNVSIVS